jgi:hypothetical protein
MSYNNAAARKRLLGGPGYLYTTLRESDLAIKIGLSADPLRRFYSFRASFSARVDRYSLLWIVAVPVMDKCERSLHAICRPRRITGEWFRLEELEAHRVLSRLGSPEYIGIPFGDPRHIERCAPGEF